MERVRRLMDVKTPGTLVALHGFLGEATDWNPVFSHLEGKTPHRLMALDYSKINVLSPQETFVSEWGWAFNDWWHAQKISGPLYLMGYSQGGRLALQALAAMGNEVSKLILVSSNPGLSSKARDDRAARRETDEAWAVRFEKDPWEKVMADWNKQEIFIGGKDEPVRKESPENRRAAVEALRKWSVGRQENFRSVIRRRAGDIQWIIGEHDKKYTELALSLNEVIPNFQPLTIKGSGHRVPFDQPAAVANAIVNFLK